MRFSSHVDRAVEAALRAAAHQVRTLCRDCLGTVGQGALANVKADLLLSIHGRRFPHALLKQAPQVRAKAVWLLDEPQEVDLSEGYGRHFDIVLTNDRNTCGVHGPHKTWYLPLAADPEAHKPGGSAAAWDVAFVGGILPERAALLDQAYQLAPDLAWRIVGPDRWHKPVSFGPVWENRTVSHEEYVEAISSARIVLDIPRDETVSFAGRTNRRGIPATGVGCRPFEITACGRFLLTDDSRADLPVLFPEGVGCYRRGDAASLVEQVRYWLEDEEERREAALAAREHCLRKHTYAVRVSELADIVGAWLDTRLPAAPARPAKPPRLAAKVEAPR
jgi:spore maturation protein CgeB